MSQFENVQALIALLDDSDQEIYHQVATELITLGSRAIPSLETAWHTRPDPILQNRIEQLIHKIQFDLVIDEFSSWKNCEAPSLVEGLIILTRYAYPEFDAQDALRHINKIKQDVWLEFNYDLTPLEETHVFNQVFYKHHYFTGRTKAIKQPETYFINNLLDNKRGNPHSLGILYLAIAQMLKLPLYAVCLPYYFILARVDKEYEDLSLIKEENVLYYVDPFNKGAVFSKKEIEGFLAKSRISPKQEYFLPSTNTIAITEALKHLQQLYGEQGNDRQVDDLNSMMDLLEK